MPGWAVPWQNASECARESSGKSLWGNPPGLHSCGSPFFLSSPHRNDRAFRLPPSENGASPAAHLTDGSAILQPATIKFPTGARQGPEKSIFRTRPCGANRAVPHYKCPRASLSNFIHIRTHHTHPKRPPPQNRCRRQAPARGPVAVNSRHRPIQTQTQHTRPLLVGRVCVGSEPTALAAGTAGPA